MSSGTLLKPLSLADRLSLSLRPFEIVMQVYPVLGISHHFQSVHRFWQSYGLKQWNMNYLQFVSVQINKISNVQFRCDSTPVSAIVCSELALTVFFDS